MTAIEDFGGWLRDFEAQALRRAERGIPRGRRARAWTRRSYAACSGSRSVRAATAAS